MTAHRTELGHCPCCQQVGVERTFKGVERQLPAAERTPQQYAVCAHCATWFATGELFDAPRHYPAKYYSFSTSPDSTVTRMLRGARARHATIQRSILGWSVVRALGVPDGLAAFARLGVRSDARILDVGAGGGRLVRDLHAAGFRKVVGCDAFGQNAAGPPRLVRGGLAAVSGSWDVIMYHHCLEHIDDPVEELRRAASRLAPEGTILVRVPLADSDAADEYGDRWVQLDAPRHRVIPTAAGLHAMAALAGLTVAAEWRDSSAFQFWGSELYRRDVALRAEAGLHKARFDAGSLRRWKSRAQLLNAEGRGDQGAFILHPAVDAAPAQP